MKQFLIYGLCGLLFLAWFLASGTARGADRLPGLPDGCGTRCHKSKVREQFVHGPVATDDCIACHRPTGKPHPDEQGAFRLVGEREKLCAVCHESKATKKVVHPPVAEGDCLACHDVHQSPYPMQLKAPGADLCFGCHNAKDFSAKHGHAPVAAGHCTRCHDPHQSDNPALLKAPGAQLCFSCHDKALTEGVSVHKPVAEGRCTDCHAPHGSPFPSMLKGEYPEEFYLPYKQANFELCFRCHTRELAQDRRTDTLTGFRNGDFNLHYVHVNRSDKGRSCKTCHDPHAAGQLRLIKKRIPGFGSWDIPIHYTKTDTGGTCVVGCHKPKSYDRLRFVTNP